MEAGCEVTILFADLHAKLDALKTDTQLLEKRTKYYIVLIIEILKRFNADINRIKFVVGSSFQKSPQYIEDLLTALTMTSVRDAMHAGAEVVKQSDNPLLSGLVYPIMQALDEQYLDSHIQLGGSDQRKIFTLARELLPKLGYKKRVHLMNPMIPALSRTAGGSGGKMSASDLVAKIDFLDDSKKIDMKIKQAYCLEGDPDDNTPLILVKHILLPLLKRFDKKLVCPRPVKYGGPQEYDTYEDLYHAFAKKELHPADLKKGIVIGLDFILEPIRQAFTPLKI